MSDGTRDLRVSLQLVPDYEQVTTVITNVGGSNQMIITVTNTITYRGWELIRENNRSVWYQSYPKYVLGNSEATSKIYDYDAPSPPTISLALLDDAAVESGNDYATVAIRRSGNLDGDVVVKYMVSGVASNGVDYVYLPGTITLRRGDAEQDQDNPTTVQFLKVIPYDDLFVEGNEDVTISLLEDDAYTIGNGSVTLYIVENDLPLMTVNSTDPIAYEGNLSAGQFTVTRSGNVSSDLTVYYLLTGSAQNGVDYDPLPGDLVIPAGQLSASILVRPRNDGVVESNETVTLLISDHPTYNIGPPNTATVVIQDGSLPLVTLRATDGAASEAPDNGLFTFTRSGPLTNSLLVNFEVGGSAVPQADYQAIGTNILFPANVASVALNIVPLNDDFRETNDTVIIRLLPAPTYHVGTPDSGTVTIAFNDDANLPEISFAARTSSVLESAGEALLSVRLSAPITATNRAAMVEWRISGGSATANVDYSLSATGYVFFDLDAPLIQDISVRINNDQLPEPSETLLVSLFHPNVIITNFVITTNLMGDFVTNEVYNPAPTNAFLGSYRTHTLTIIDDDSSTVSIAAPDAYAFEAGRDPAVITILREGNTNTAQTVFLAIAGTASGGNDYVALPRSVVIPAGSTSVTINVVPFDDPEEEVTETIWVTIVRAPGANIGRDFVELYIVDNDGTIQFATPEVHVPENQGVAQVGVVRSGDTNLAVSVQYVIQEGTATFNRDFLATNGVLNFAPGEMAKTIPVTIVNDFAVEPDETVLLYLTNVSGGVPLGGQTAATLFIDNDDTSVQFASSFYTVNENGGSTAIEIQRVGLLSRANSVRFTTLNGSATNGLDYTGVTNTVSFGVGETSKVVTVQITDDFIFEGNESVQLVLSNPSTNTIIGSSNAVLVIFDDECAIGFSQATFATNEYAPYARVIVTRTGGTVNPVSVDFTTANGTASNLVDYVATSGTISFAGDQWVLASDGSGRLEFRLGETQKEILVGLIDDALGEADETFQVRLSNARAISGPARSVVLGNGSPTNATVVILDNEGPGNVDYEHNSGEGANGRVLAVALQSPGSRAVFGGQFTSVNGVGLNRVGRLNLDGSVDPSFNPGLGANQDVLAIATQSDGKILIGGAFSSVDTTFRSRIARLNANGSLDTTFAQGSGANGIVRAIAVQADGRILIGGDFTSVNGSSRSRLARLNADGSTDFSFTANANGPVNAIAVQANGRIVIGGGFTLVGGFFRSSIARLNTSGSVDTTFDPGSGANGPVNAVAALSDGRVILGGAFTGINGSIRNRIARLNDDGTVDALFDPGIGANGNVNTLAVQSNGRAIIGGEFTNLDGQFLNRFARLKADGKVDTAFDSGTGADGAVRSLVIQNDSAIVLGGDFSVIDSIPRNRIARIHGDEKSNIVGVEFLTATPSVIENAGQVAITLVRTGNTNVAFSVSLLATNGTATPALDYVATNVTVNFARGDLSKSINIRILDDTAVEPDEYVALVLTNGSANVDLSSTAPGLLTIIDNEQSFRFATNSFVALEDDGVVFVTVARDGFRAGTVTVDFRVQDGTATAVGDYTATNGMLTFTNGEAAKVVAVQLTNDRQEEGTETAQLVLSNPGGAALGNPATATLTIIDTDVTYGTITFESTNRITIFDGTPAVPYPSTINVSGLSGVVGRVEVTLSNLSHTFPDDIDILLVAPNGRSVVVMSDVGGSADALNVTLRLSDLAEMALPNSSLLVSGTNQPTDFEPGDVFPSPAPAGPYGGALNWLNGGNPNGDWKLFVRDDRGSDTGEILNGWKLHITTVNPANITDLGLGIQDSPDPLQAGEILTYTLSLTNLGPRLATGVKVTDLLPPDMEFRSAVPSQGSCAQSNATIVCDLGGIDVNGLAQIMISVRPLVGGSMTNSAFVTQDQNDVEVPNNSALAVTTVNTAPVADLVISISDSPDPIFAGQDLTYSINITNRGPLNATGVVLSDVLPANVSFVSAVSSRGQCTLASGRVTCNLGVLNSGTAASASIVVRPSLTGKVVNTVSLSANEGDLTPAEASTETTVYPSADVAVFVTESQDPLPLEAVLTYTVSVTNQGPNIARGVNIVDTLPDDAPLQGVLASQGSCYVAGSLLICDFGVLPPGASASVAIDVLPQHLGVVQNAVSVLAADFDTVRANNSQTNVTTVTRLGGLTVTPTTNALELAAAVTAGGNTGLRVTSARLSGHQAGEATSSGTFISAPSYTYGLRRPGIVLSSGNVKDYESGPNRSPGTTTAYGLPAVFGVPATLAQENLLDPITRRGNQTFNHFDVTQLDIVFDLLPGYDRVEFKVAFGSEEYPEYVNSTFIDGFGLYLNGSNIAFTAGAPINIRHPAMRPLDGTELDGVLAPNGDAVVTFSAPLPPGSLNNTLTIIVADTSDPVLDTTVYVSSLQGAEPLNTDMAVDIVAAPEPVVVGGTLTYTITALNRGPEIATNVFLSSQAPPGTTLLGVTSSQGFCFISGGTVNCLLDNLARGSNAVVQLSVRPNVEARISNFASVSSDLQDLRPTNNTAFVTSTVVTPGAFLNTKAILLADAAPAMPYPSVINVSGLSGSVSKVTVTLTELSHSFPGDLDILLVSPTGQKAVLMSDSGQGGDLNSVTLRFDDDATSSLPAAGTITSGSYKPTNIGNDDSFYPPAPIAPYGNSLAVFRGDEPNGPWSLYIMDDEGADSGSLAGGWRLTILTGAATPAPGVEIRRSGAEVRISWPDPSPGYVLESTEALGSGATWTRVPDAAVSGGGRLRVNVPVGSGNQFFRLRKGTSP
ncbi:MAG TPA: Calx-beta domain-containing protein [Verrucomicrobiae bacterium]|nr:Calx-beta domain-containing protein [Verrucomicrobiae bacterium]